MQRRSKGWDEQSKCVDRPSHWSLSQAWGQGANRGRRDIRRVFRCGSPYPRQPFRESGVRRSSCELRGPPPPSTCRPVFSLPLPLGAALPFPPPSVAAFPPSSDGSPASRLPQAVVLLPAAVPVWTAVRPPSTQPPVCGAIPGGLTGHQGCGVAWLWSSRPGTAQGWSGWCSQLLSESRLPLGWMHPKAKDWGCFCLPGSTLL